MADLTMFSRLPAELRTHIGGFVPQSQNTGYASLSEIAPLVPQMYQLSTRKLPYTPGLVHLEVFRTDADRIPPMLLPELQRYPFYSYAEIQYRGELKHGPAIFFNDQGKVVARGSFTDDQKTGVWDITTTDGTQTIQEQGMYQSGTRTGSWSVKIELSGVKIDLTIPYENGQKHGFVRFSDVKELMSRNGLFVKDQLYGEVSLFRMIPDTLFYKNRLVIKNIDTINARFEFYNEDGTVERYSFDNQGVLKQFTATPTHHVANLYQMVREPRGVASNYYSNRGPLLDREPILSYPAPMEYGYMRPRS